MSPVDPLAIAARLGRLERKAIMTPSGKGEYNGATYQKLRKKGLVDIDLRWTPLCLQVREII
ncbi:MAG: hypothetical protein E6R03_03230 [Hyphomicrobiaceae bacterium]|nr:MAG: hypothetical protein E6R03_03230 [Hyphomicrobiaceae bacterium]